jgi:predicted metal-dependent hydrolase
VDKSIIENIGRIGEVCFVQSDRARRLNISIRPGRPVRVAIPPYASMNEARNFLASREDWILKHLEKLSKSGINLIFNESSVFTTLFHELRIIRSQRKNLHARTINGSIEIEIPIQADLDKVVVQQFIKKALIETMRLEAKLYIPERVRELALKHGFSYQGVAVKNLRSRWGSCSSTGNINLNLHLMTLPAHLIDFIILHELCHTVHRNHGKGFKKLLGQVSGNMAGLEKEMKQYRIRFN